MYCIRNKKYQVIHRNLMEQTMHGNLMDTQNLLPKSLNKPYSKIKTHLTMSITI